MSASKKQRFTLYLLTLLFIWVNGFAAPYQSIQNASSKATTSAVKVTDSPLSITGSNTEPATIHQPYNESDQGIHSAYPAEETFEEQEEDQRKDLEGILYVSLPGYLSLSILSSVNFPDYLPQYSEYSATRKQSTYLLDCSFLI